MQEITLIITMAPTVEITESDLIAPIVLGCIDQNTADKTNFKIKIDEISNGRVKFVSSYKGPMIQIDELKKFAVTLESNDPKMWTIFRDMTRKICHVTSLENPSPIPIRCYMGDIAEYFENRIEQPPYWYTIDDYYGKPMALLHSDTDDDDTDLPFDELEDESDTDDDDDDTDREYRERIELENSRRERREDTRAYYFDRL